MRADLRRVAGILAVAGLALLGAACGDDDAGATAPVLSVHDARASAGEVHLAAYLTIHNDGGGDRLTGVTVDDGDGTEIGVASIHETLVDDEGRSAMQEIDGLDVPGSDHVVLEPGGHHLMVEELVRPVEAGEVLRLELRFAEANPITTDLEVVALEDVLDHGSHDHDHDHSGHDHEEHP